MQVINDGTSRATTAAPAGHGLIGMRERVGLLGGTLEAGTDRAAASGSWPAPGERRPMSIRLLIADDQELVRIGFRLFLETQPDMERRRRGRRRRAGVSLARELRPDVILMDIRMPRMDGIEAIERLQREPSTRSPACSS